jgi:hypothetical protein
MPTLAWACALGVESRAMATQAWPWHPARFPEIPKSRIPSSVTTLIESPVPVLLAGIVAAAILAILFFNSGRGRYLLFIGGVVLLTIAGLAIEHFVVTEREEVESSLYGLADAMEANNKNAAVGFISPSAAAIKTQADLAFARFEVLQASISNLEITINDLTSPPSAEARFNSLIRVRDRKGEMPYGGEPFYFIVKFRKESDRWLITDHKEKISSLSGPPRDFNQRP